MPSLSSWVTIIYPFPKILTFDLCDSGEFIICRMLLYEDVMRKTNDDILVLWIT